MTNSMDAPSEETLVGWLTELSNAGRWGSDDVLGTLNFVEAEHRRAAAALVRSGQSVSCALPIKRGDGPDVMEPVSMELVADPLDRAQAQDGRRWQTASDRFGMFYHGLSITHLDALPHFFWQGRGYNGLEASAVSKTEGITRGSVDAVRDGIVTRGVLLDIADLRHIDWMEGGEAISVGDLVNAAKRSGIQVGRGDALLVRTGYGAKRRRIGPDPITAMRPGLSAGCLPWLHEHEIAVLGSDTASDVSPSSYTEMPYPIHTIGLSAMGLWLIDNCDLEDLAAACAELSRFEFQFVLAPLGIEGATGSPVNPLAIL